MILTHGVIQKVFRTLSLTHTHTHSLSLIIAYDVMNNDRSLPAVNRSNMQDIPL